MSGGGGSKSDNTIHDTPEQRYAAQVAAEKWNFAQSTLAPLENEYMDRVEDMTSGDRMSYLRGRSNLNQQSQLSEGLGQIGQQMGLAGLDPSSGRFTSTQADLAGGMAQVGGEQAGRSQFEQQTQQIRGLQNITAIGTGQAGQAQVGLGRIADQSAVDARSDAVTSFNRKSANLQLLGALGGAASNFGLNTYKTNQANNQTVQNAMTGAGFDSGSQFQNGFGLSTGGLGGLKYGV